MYNHIFNKLSASNPWNQMPEEDFVEAGPIDILNTYFRPQAPQKWIGGDETMREILENQMPGRFGERLSGYDRLMPNRKPGSELFGLKGTERDLMSLLKRRESGGNHKAVNTLGYSGAYQFGPQALEQVGLLKKGASKYGMKALDNPELWNIPGGKQAFLENPEIQERAMKSLMDNNLQQLKKLGIVNSQTPQDVINGYLAAAHLGGVGGVKKLINGKEAKDAYGTSVRDYFNLGRRAV